MPPLVIVCRNSMLLGGRLDTTRRPFAAVRTSTDRRRAAPRDGIWCYIAHADRLDRVSRQSLPEAPQWRMARKMRAGEDRFVSLLVAADRFSRHHGHYVGHASDEAIATAVETLRQRWMEPLYVMWDVQRSVPDERLPCQWAAEPAPAPKFLRAVDATRDDWY